MSNKITLFTEEVIDSCHHLEGYDGKCKRYHGHTWLIKIWIQGTDEQKDDVGILFDFGNIKKIKETFDHTDLNEIPLFKSSGLKEKINPTAENITMIMLKFLLNINPSLEYRIRIYETAVKKETWCQRQTDNFDINYL